MLPDFGAERDTRPLLPDAPGEVPPEADRPGM